MYNTLMELSGLHLFIIISLSIVTISIFSTWIIRLTVPANIRFRDNAVIIGTSSLISIVYGVLVGISALYLINNNSYTADAVQREANAISDVYRDSKWLPEAIKTNVQNKIKSYVNSVINNEWILMNKGLQIDNKNDFLIDDILKNVLSYTPLNNTERFLQQNIISNLQNLFNARQQRIHMSYEKLNPDLWIVILIVTALMLFINYLYEMNLYLHLLTVSVAALMSSSMIYLLIAMDGPFQGEFKIQPTAMHAVLSFMNGTS